MKYFDEVTEAKKAITASINPLLYRLKKLETNKKADAALSVWTWFVATELSKIKKNYLAFFF